MKPGPVFSGLLEFAIFVEGQPSGCVWWRDRHMPVAFLLGMPWRVVAGAIKRPTVRRAVPDGSAAAGELEP